MRKFLLSCACLLAMVPAHLFAQNNNGTLDQIEELSKGFTFPFIMPDGIKLMTDVYLPITQDCLLVDLSFNIPDDSPIFPGDPVELGNIEIIPKGIQFLMYDSVNGAPNPDPYQLPAVFTRTPYEKDGDPLGQYVALFGYASFVQDMRGRYTSEGVYMPMYSDSWRKDPYHPGYGHVLDVTSLSDPKNGNFHEDGWNSVVYMTDSLKRDYGSLPHTNDDFINGDIAMFGASALGNTQYQAAAAHRVDPTGKGLKALLPIVATNEHYRFTGYQNGVFRDRIVTGWLKGQIFTGIDDDLLPLDFDIHDNIHTSFDYGMPNKFVAANASIDHFSTVRYDGEVAGYYPNSKGRADMDASAAPVDEFGEGDAEGTHSRYENMRVPAYHLTGWWDIFTDGTIETWKLMKKHNDPTIANMQKLVIGPWAHQTIGSRESGDLVYPANVQDILKVDLEDIDSDEIPIGEMLQSEIIAWFRYNLNWRPDRQLGEPKVLIPESSKWQDVGSIIDVRVPARDYIVNFDDLINFLTGNAGLPGLPIEGRDGFTGLLTFDLDLDVPAVGAILPDFDVGEAKLTEYQDFPSKPSIRFYVPGPVEDGIPENEGVGNYWYAAEDFPLVNHIRWTDYFLHQDGSIDQTAPTTDEGNIAYVHDPDDPILTVGGANMIVKSPLGDRDSQGQMNLADPDNAPFTMDRPGVIKFETEELTDTLCIVGFPKVELFAKSNPAGEIEGPTDTDFFIRVVDVYPDGREFFVVEGCVNARARNYAAYIANTGEEDVDIPFTNIALGHVYGYYFQLMPIAYTWGKGHKMKILISSSNYTRYQVNPNLPIEEGDFFRRKPGDGRSYNFEGKEMLPRVAVNRVYFSPEYPTHIELPVYDPTFIVGNEEEQVEFKPGLDATIYPNPANDRVTLAMGIPGDYSYQVHNMMGQLITEGNIYDRQELQVNDYETGVYLVEFMEKESGTRFTRKLVIR